MVQPRLLGIAVFAAVCLSGCASVAAVLQDRGPERPAGRASYQPADESWSVAREEALARIQLQHRPQQARNVILFVADGLSIPTIAASRIFEGQRNGGDGVTHTLSFERFPHAALVRTYNTDAQVPDSASTATALVTGIKTRTGAISIASDQFLEICADPSGVPLTLAEIAEERGMSTGVVSTARITHATPATMYAHSVSRQWEADSEMPDDALAAGCRDIALQLLNFSAGDGMEVALGGGRAAFYGENDGGIRADARNLMDEWEAAGGVAVSDADGFRAIGASDDRPVLGLFTEGHMAFEADRDDAEEPSLAEMTAFAIDRLAGNPEGYVLMVEAGRVDHAHHGTNAYRAFTDTEAYAAAVQAAVERVDLDETLIVVTADHGHTMMFAGYPARGNPVLDIVRRANPWEPGSAPAVSFDMRGRPYTAIGYHNGPNPRVEDGEPLSSDVVLDPDYQQESAVPLHSQTHSGADVALFATGARAHYFGGSLEQNSVFHLIAAALGWDPEAPIPSRDIE